MAIAPGRAYRQAEDSQLHLLKVLDSSRSGVAVDSAGAQVFRLGTSMLRVKPKLYSRAGLKSSRLGDYLHRKTRRAKDISGFQAGITGWLQVPAETAGAQIGRASCRERVKIA